MLLLFFFFLAGMPGFAQKITYSCRGEALQRVFLEIKKQTGYHFLYDDDVLKHANRVTMDVKAAALERVLVLCFKDQPLEYAIVEKTILVKPKAVPPPLAGNLTTADSVVHVAGRVTDEQGAPVEGASITVRHSNKGTFTNAIGVFELYNVPVTAILQVSSQGYETKEVALPRDLNFKSTAPGFVMTIPLRIKQEKMAEVVVTTAYGLERQLKQVGYAVSKVSGKEIMQTSPTNLLTGLTGKVPGMTISTLGSGTTPSIRVLLRGIRSLSGNNLPLFVLNGMQLSQGSDQAATNATLDLINSLNPADVEDVMVLKGANAAALYGPEGVNGVILITTKKGRGKTQVVFQYNSTFQQVDPRWPKYQTGFGPGFMVNEFGDGIYDPLGNYQHWGAPYDGQEVVIGRPDEQGEVQKVPYAYTKERDRFWEIGQTVQHSLSISGGDLQSNFFFGMGHLVSKGIIPGDRVNRTSIRLNAGRKYGRFFELNTNLAFSHNRSNVSVANVMSSIRNTGGHIPLTRYKDYVNDKWSDRNHYYNDYFINPYEELGTRRSKSTVNTFIGNFEVIFKPFRWLQLTNRLGFTHAGSDSKGTMGALEFSEFAKNSGRLVSMFDQAAQVMDAAGSMTGINNDVLVTLQRNAGDFSFKATVGNSIRENSTKNLTANAFNLIIPDLYNLRNNNGPVSAGEKNTITRSYSFLGTLLMGYRDMAFVEFTGRKDWDSKLAAAARSRNFYGGVNTSLVLTELVPGFKGSAFLSNARVTAAFAKTANMNIGPYEIETSFYVAPGFPYGQVSGYTLNAGQANPAIRPERVLSREYGIELGFLKNRVLLNASYYFQKNDGQIMQVALTRATGFGGTKLNSGKFRNDGFEFDLRLNPLISTPGGFSVSGGIQFSINNNKVLSLYGNQQSLPVSSTLTATVGKPAFVHTLAGWKRDSLGRVIVDRLTGYPEVDPEPIVLGGSLPRYTGGFNVDLAWKNISLHLVGEYRGGHYYYHGAGQLTTAAGHDVLSAVNGRQRFVFPNSVYEENGKLVENRDVVVQEAQSYLLGSLFSTASTNYYTSAAFWKLREVVIGYTVPLKVKWLKQLTVSITGRNLVTFLPSTNKWGDPELGAGYNNAIATSNTAGAESDDYTLPGTRYFGLNLNFIF